MRGLLRNQLSGFGPQAQKPANDKPAKGKRLTLPLEDRLVLAELRDLIVGDSDSRLERIAVASERTATALEKVVDELHALGVKVCDGQQGGSIDSHHVKPWKATPDIFERTRLGSSDTGGIPF